MSLCSKNIFDQIFAYHSMNLHIVSTCNPAQTSKDLEVEHTWMGGVAKIQRGKIITTVEE